MNSNNLNHNSSLGPGGTVLRAMGQIDTHISPAPAASASTFDLFDSLPPSPPRQQQQQQAETTLIPNATVSITQTAPNIAGLGKITPSSQPRIQSNKPAKKRVIIPTYSINGGLDMKFNSNPRDARPLHLHNLITPAEYEAAVNVINDNLKKYRNNKIDKICLASGPLMVPLAIWGVRHNTKVKKSRGEIERSVEEFNDRMGMEGRAVKMFWNRSRGGGESYLSIEEVDDGEYNPPSASDGKGYKVD